MWQSNERRMDGWMDEYSRIVLHLRVRLCLMLAYIHIWNDVPCTLYLTHLLTTTPMWIHLSVYTFYADCLKPQYKLCAMHISHCSHLIAQRFHLHLMSKSMYLRLTLKVIWVNHLEWLIPQHESMHIIDDFNNNRLINDLYTADTGCTLHATHCTSHIRINNLQMLIELQLTKYS